MEETIDQEIGKWVASLDEQARKNPQVDWELWTRYVSHLPWPASAAICSESLQILFFRRHHSPELRRAYRIPRQQKRRPRLDYQHGQVNVSSEAIVISPRGLVCTQHCYRSAYVHIPTSRQERARPFHGSKARFISQRLQQPLTLSLGDSPHDPRAHPFFP